MSSPDWRFLEEDGDGEAWLASPSELFAFVRATDPADGQPYSIMVVTNTWLSKQASAIRRGAKHSFLAPMLVIRDGSPAELRSQIDEALSQPRALSMFGRPGAAPRSAV